MWGGRLWRSFSTLRGYPGDDGHQIISALRGALFTHYPSRRTRRVGASTTVFHQSAADALIRGLAEAFLRDWDLDGLIARGGRVLGRRHRWLRPLRTASSRRSPTACGLRWPGWPCFSRPMRGFAGRAETRSGSPFDCLAGSADDSIARSRRHPGRSRDRDAGGTGPLPGPRAE